MANLSAVRSFAHLLLVTLVVGFFAAGCKKNGGSDPEIDPRDQYVGEYTGTYRNSIYLVEDPISDPRSGTATITVTKASNAKEIYIQTVCLGDQTGDRTLTVTAELDGSNFTVIDKTTDIIPITKPVDSDYSANGSFDLNTKQVSYASVARALRNGAQYRQTYDIVGKKK